MMRSLHSLVLVSAAALLSGCISLLPEPAPAPRLFALEALPREDQTPRALDVVVAVSAPSGEGVLLGSGLVWRSGDELEFIAQTRWSTRAEDALQGMLIETFENDTGVRAALRVGEARSDYLVRWSVLDFQIEESGAGQRARFVAQANVLRTTTREVLRSTRVDTSADLSSRSASLAADALARAAREGSARIAAFAAETIAADQSSAASISR